jgi:hypothetical protein
MRNPDGNHRLAVLIGAVLCLTAAPVAAEHHIKVRWSGDLGVGYDDNVGNASDDDDVRDSTVVAGGVNLDYTHGLSLNTGLLVRGALQGEAVEAEDGLSHGRLLVMARLSHRPNGGFFMPTFSAWASAGVLEFNSAMRDGFEFRGGLFLSGPLTTAISARFGVAAVERSADSYVFDLSGWSASVNLDWAVTPGFTLYTGYQFQDGDVASTGTVQPKATHTPGGCGAASACDPDDALDGQFAYRIDASTHVGTLGINLPWSQRVALDAQLRRIDSSTPGDTRYERLQGLVSILLRF